MTLAEAIETTRLHRVAGLTGGRQWSRPARVVPRPRRSRTWGGSAAATSPGRARDRGRPTAASSWMNCRSSGARLRGADDSAVGVMRHRECVRTRMATADITHDYAPSSAGGPWGGVCDRVLPSERCGGDLSVESHSGVLAGIEGAGSVAIIIEGEGLDNLGTLAPAGLP
jgi:hypothetical protein